MFSAARIQTACPIQIRYPNTCPARLGAGTSADCVRPCTIALIAMSSTCVSSMATAYPIITLRDHGLSDSSPIAPTITTTPSTTRITLPAIAHVQSRSSDWSISTACGTAAVSAPRIAMQVSSRTPRIRLVTASPVMNPGRPPPAPPGGAYGSGDMGAGGCWL